jgi:hypothetical protein
MSNGLLLNHHCSHLRGELVIRRYMETTRSRCSFVGSSTSSSGREQLQLAILLTHTQSIQSPRVNRGAAGWSGVEAGEVTASANKFCE